MLRLLLTWRWVGLSLVALLAVTGMIALGQWQWERSRPASGVEAIDPGSVADPGSLPLVAGLVDPGSDVPEDLIAEPVRAVGTWDPTLTLLVADRAGAGGEPGRWVVTGLRTGEGASSRVVPVVRGWIPAASGTAAQGVAAPASGPVTVLGWLQASEPLDLPVDIVQPSGVVALLATPDLVNRWPDEIVGGFVVQAAGSSGSSGSSGGSDTVNSAPGRLVPVPLAGPPENPDTEPRDWRNLAYAGQWWVFAGFAVLLWWRMLRDDQARSRAGKSERRATSSGTTDTSTEVPQRSTA